MHSHRISRQLRLTPSSLRPEPARPVTAARSRAVRWEEVAPVDDVEDAEHGRQEGARRPLQHGGLLGAAPPATLGPGGGLSQKKNWQ